MFYLERYYVVLFIIIIISFFIIQAITFYKLGKKARVDKCWLSFIPFIQFMMIFKIIKKNKWFFILYLIPFVNIIAYIIFHEKLFEAFGIPIEWIIVGIIVPPIAAVILFYAAFSDKIKYMK